MKSLVRHEARGLRERLAARAAQQGLLTRVHALVHLQVLQQGEGLATVSAREGLFTCVDAHVYLQTSVSLHS